jgi:hypothetical protein
MLKIIPYKVGGMIMKKNFINLFFIALILSITSASSFAETNSKQFKISDQFDACINNANIGFSGSRAADIAGLTLKLFENNRIGQALPSTGVIYGSDGIISQTQEICRQAQEATRNGHLTLKDWLQLRECRVKTISCLSSFYIEIKNNI